MGNKLGAPFMRSYDDFEPYCEWKKEEGCETLVLLLPGFTKEQLRVQINNRGIIKITGERPVDETKWSRFCKQINISKDCKENEIHAKLAGGSLSIIMPKKIMPVHAIQDEHTLINQQTQEKGRSRSDTNPDKVTEKPTVNESGSAGEKSTSAENAACCRSKAMSYKLGLQSMVSRLKINKKVAVNGAMAVAVVAVVALGAYVAYRYQSSDHVKI